MKTILRLLAVTLILLGGIDIAAHVAGYDLLTEGLNVPISKVFWKLPIYFFIVAGVILWDASAEWKSPDKHEKSDTNRRIIAHRH